MFLRIPWPTTIESSSNSTDVACERLFCGVSPRTKRFFGAPAVTSNTSDRRRGTRMVTEIQKGVTKRQLLKESRRNNLSKFTDYNHATGSLPPANSEKRRTGSLFHPDTNCSSCFCATPKPHRVRLDCSLGEDSVMDSRVSAISCHDTIAGLLRNAADTACIHGPAPCRSISTHTGR